jgi:hypothetical protein
MPVLHLRLMCGIFNEGADAMQAYRVAVVAHRPLFAEGVRGLLDAEPDIEVVGVLVGADALQGLSALKPDVVVVEEAGGEARRAVWTALGGCTGSVKVIFASLEGNTLEVHYRQRLPTSSAADLIAAVRQPMAWGPQPEGRLRVLCVVQGRYGARIVQALGRNLPAEWSLAVCQLPPIVPDQVEQAGDFVPAALPRTDLLIGLGESPSAARLLPHIARVSAAGAAIVPIDRAEWVPQAIETWLHEQFRSADVEVIFPRPFCSLDESAYNCGPRAQPYRHPLIAAFARHVGHPRLRIEVSDDVGNGASITRVEIERDTPCGCAEFYAQRLEGMPVRGVLSQVGKLHLESQCMAGLSVDMVYNDTMHHVAAGILKGSVRNALSVCAQVNAASPGQLPAWLAQEVT